MKRLLIGLVVLLLSLHARGDEVAKLPPHVQRVVFIGDSITYFGGYVVDIEAYLKSRYPDQNFDVTNVGVPSETVSGLNEDSRNTPQLQRPDLHDRLEKILQATKPDLAFVCYGMNDPIYMPFDETRFARFREGMIWTHDTIARTGARVIHITPPVYDESKAGVKGYNDVLARYSRWLTEQTSQGWDVVDVHTPTTQYLVEHRATDPTFVLSKDGIHPDDLGHWLIAKAILQHLGAKDLDAATADEAFAHAPGGSNLLKLVRQRHDLLRNARMTAWEMRRPSMKKGLPLPEAEAQAAELSKQIDALVHAPATRP